MGKRLSDIASFVDSKTSDFKKYLESELDSETQGFISRLTEASPTYLFSGVIRNFFLGYREIRDVDLVVESHPLVNEIISDYDYRVNSFGGYKIQLNKLPIDLWYVDRTWAFTKNQTTMDFGADKLLPHTAFFNFSSIMYSFREERFYYNKQFLYFIKDREIDAVYLPNANYKLCLVNTFYYADRYQLKISDRLMKWVIKTFQKESKEYSGIQHKHFGEVLYGDEEIERRVLAATIT